VEQDNAFTNHSDLVASEWRTQGITNLGPFGHIEVADIGSRISVKIERGTLENFDKKENVYTVTAQGLNSMDSGKRDIYLNHLAPQGATDRTLKGHLSPPNKITIDKPLLGLQPYIKSFAWCYPLNGLTIDLHSKIVTEIKTRGLEVDSFDYFLLNGGYVYWTANLDKNEEIGSIPKCALAIFINGDSFMFTPPHPLPTDPKWCDEKYFGTITIKGLKATHFRWLTPMECEKLLGRKILYRIKKDGLTVPLLGGFAYLYPDRKLNNYFMLLPPPIKDIKKSKAGRSKTVANVESPE